MQIYKLKSVWRSRTIAILGGLVFLLALFSGFPSWLEQPLYLLLGVAIMIFGLAGSRPEGEPPVPAPTPPPHDTQS